MQVWYCSEFTDETTMTLILFIKVSKCSFHQITVTQPIVPNPHAYKLVKDHNLLHSSLHTNSFWIQLKTVNKLEKKTQKHSHDNIKYTILKCVMIKNVIYIYILHFWSLHISIRIDQQLDNHNSWVIELILWI